MGHYFRGRRLGKGGRSKSALGRENKISCCEVQAQAGKTPVRSIRGLGSWYHMGQKDILATQRLGAPYIPRACDSWGFGLWVGKRQRGRGVRLEAHES
jgi:hypothetical protein